MSKVFIVSDDCELDSMEVWFWFVSSSFLFCWIIFCVIVLLCFLLSHLFKNWSTLFFFFLIFLSLVIDDIDDPMKVWIMDGNDLKCGSVSTMRRLRDRWILGMIQVQIYIYFDSIGICCNVSLFLFCLYSYFVLCLLFCERYYC